MTTVNLKRLAKGGLFDRGVTVKKGPYDSVCIHLFSVSSTFGIQNRDQTGVSLRKGLGT